MPELSDSQIRAVVDRIFDECAPEKVIVFGSQVSGQPEESSDLDLLVVVEPDECTLREIQIDIYKHLHGFMFGIDVLVISPEEFEAQRRHEHTLPGEAYDKGYSVFHRSQR